MSNDIGGYHEPRIRQRERIPTLVGLPRAVTETKEQYILSQTTYATTTSNSGTNPQNVKYPARCIWETLRPALAANARSPTIRSRPMFVQDKTSHSRFLIDTGADVSVIPPTIWERTHQRGSPLQAAKNTTIPTYGEKSMTLNLGLRRVFPWIFTIYLFRQRSPSDGSGRH